MYSNAFDYAVTVSCSCGIHKYIPYNMPGMTTIAVYWRPANVHAFLSVHDATSVLDLSGGKPGQNCTTRCKTCGYTGLTIENVKHDHNITGTHYVCTQHNYVGTSQLH